MDLWSIGFQVIKGRNRLASYGGFLHAGMVMNRWRGELVARSGARKRYSKLREDRGKIEAVARLRRRAEMDRLGSARCRCLLDTGPTSRRCATLVAARGWQDARRCAQGNAGRQHLTLQASTGGERHGRWLAISQARGRGGNSGHQHVARG